MMFNGFSNRVTARLSAPLLEDINYACPRRRSRCVTLVRATSPTCRRFLPFNRITLHPRQRRVNLAQRGCTSYAE